MIKFISVCSKELKISGGVCINLVQDFTFLTNSSTVGRYQKFLSEGLVKGVLKIPRDLRNVNISK